MFQSIPNPKTSITSVESTQLDESDPFREYKVTVITGGACHPVVGVTCKLKHDIIHQSLHKSYALPFAKYHHQTSRGSSFRPILLPTPFDLILARQRHIAVSATEDEISRVFVVNRQPTSLNGDGGLEKVADGLCVMINSWMCGQIVGNLLENPQTIVFGFRERETGLISQLVVPKCWAIKNIPRRRRA